MKAINLKKMMPFAVFVLGILGAFGTTSMQSAEAEDAPIDGYISTPGKPCDIQVPCSDQFGQVCRLGYDDVAEPQAYAKEGMTTCALEVYRPQ